MSKNTKSLQQQLFQALVAQTFIPLILMYIPITILFLFPMIGYDIGQLSSFVTSTISIYPAIDPIPNISQSTALYGLTSTSTQNISTSLDNVIESQLGLQCGTCY
ncbi:unnamed protein product [Caenorhabditis angaria]|uniref:Uncharacterized protein n=1 Tax=Caenorhabditis angaria TaxID=860376 RepID=A0A9P1N6E8_9PELO|nr:unnamed protein product [Caenorhabditis angaria]